MTITSQNEDIPDSKSLCLQKNAAPTSLFSPVTGKGFYCRLKIDTVTLWYRKTDNAFTTPKTEVG